MPVTSLAKRSMMHAGTPPAESGSGGPKVLITQLPAPLHWLVSVHERLGSPAQNEPTLPKKSHVKSLTPSQFERSREDTWKRALPRAMQAIVEQLREADVVVAGEEAGEDQRHRQRERSQPDPALSPEVPGCNLQPPGHLSQLFGVQPTLAGTPGSR